jgi:hypothetical protein
MNEQEQQIAANVAHLTHGATLAMQAVVLALMRSHPDPAALKRALGETMAAMRATVALSNVSLGGKPSRSKEAFDNHSERWLQEMHALHPHD